MPMSRSSSDPDRSPRASDPGEEGPDATVPIDSRIRADRRSGTERRQKKKPVPEERRSGEDRRQGLDRRKPDRKRSINEYRLDADAKELANALSAFRREHSNRFPTVAQILVILRDLGYEKRDRS